MNKLGTILKAIADPTRREIFHLLILGSAALSITQISEHFSMSRQAVTKHIKYLESAGLVEITKKGREQFCIANSIPLKEVDNWIETYERFWHNKLNDLDTHLKSKRDNRT